jgi:tocopherol cyclase
MQSGKDRETLDGFAPDRLVGQRQRAATMTSARPAAYGRLEWFPCEVELDRLRPCLTYLRVCRPMRSMINRYRQTGADPPYFDPRRDHAARFEGYYWRFSDHARGRVVIALCGLCRLPGHRWAVVALAAHPGGRVHESIAGRADADSEAFGVRAGTAVAASDRSVRFDLGAAARLNAELVPTSTWPRRRWGGSGVGQLVPGLPQYWHPWLLGGVARGEATIDGERIILDGANAYAEKNWGRAFPERWWWGQADAFDVGDACVAFAGGPLRVARLAPTLVAIRVEERLISLTPPLAQTAAAVEAGSWRLRTRSPRYAVEIEGEEHGSSVRLPVPTPDRVAVESRSTQALAGRLRVVVRNRRRTLFRGESELAGLEHEIDR